jgi:hypothetical protein
MMVVFRIPADNVTNYVFLNARHLNLMDKIRSHSNEFKSLISKF